MAWEWSHTQEAYDDAHTNLCGLKMVDLRIIYAEWVANTPEDEDGDPLTDGFDQEAYKKGLRETQGLTLDVLVDYIWERASEHRTCDNGGFNAWVCPYGCHTVSFSKDAECRKRASRRGLLCFG